MADQSNELKAREYVFDLGNVAKENWFKPDESWELSLATSDEKSAIERKYYPTVSAHPEQEGLFEFLRLVKGKLLLPLSKQEYGFDADSNGHKNLRHLIAFNPKMHR